MTAVDTRDGRRDFDGGDAGAPADDGGVLARPYRALTLASCPSCC
jgi:hypothetical protein